ncbi:MAG: hypothetical protein MJ237_03610 [bacterium]|nr:hypothetical protein [bacterium]
MAKIIKIGSTPKISTVNLAKTSRTTNPFKYTNFDGTSLPYADVFEGFEPKNISRLKLIASSVAGSMNKIRTGITEPIVHFVVGLKHGISSAWDYANNTNISDLKSIKKINEIANMQINLPGETLIKNSVADLKMNISSGLENLEHGFISFGKDISEKWNSITSKIHSGKISSGMSVSELEEMWKQEIANAGLKGAA